jgi:hypothetical protein
VAAAQSPDRAASVRARVLQLGPAILFASVPGGLGQMFSATLTAAIYVELRRIKEGGAARQLAEVFA